MSPDGERSTNSVTPQEISSALSQGIGGTRGVLDSGLPTAVFLVVYLVTGQSLMPSVWAAVAAGLVIAVIRKIRKEPLQQILGGLVGLGIAAFLAARTGRAEDFFLPGILINVAYGLAFAVSALIRRPLVGYAAGAVTGDLLSWSKDAKARQAATAATWLWAGMFGLRLLVQLPLYFAGAVEALGVMKLVMGWPLFLLVAFLSYRIMSPALARLAKHDVGPDPTTEGATNPEDSITPAPRDGAHDRE